MHTNDPDTSYLSRLEIWTWPMLIAIQAQLALSSVHTPATRLGHSFVYTNQFVFNVLSQISLAHIVFH